MILSKWFSVDFLRYLEALLVAVTNHCVTLRNVICCIHTLVSHHISLTGISGVTAVLNAMEDSNFEEECVLVNIVTKMLFCIRTDLVTNMNVCHTLPGVHGADAVFRAERETGPDLVRVESLANVMSILWKWSLVDIEMTALFCSAGVHGVNAQGLVGNKCKEELVRAKEWEDVLDVLKIFNSVEMTHCIQDVPMQTTNYTQFVVHFFTVDHDYVKLVQYI